MPTAVCRLDDVCSVTMGQAPSGDAYNSTGTGWPLIAGAGDFLNGRARAKKYTTEASKLSTDGDIVLGIRASIGAKVWSDGVYCLGRGVAGLRPRPGLDAGYLWHWLTHSAPALAAKGKGATFKQVNRQDIGEMPIALPKLDEQRRIAAILDQADGLRAKRREALVHLEDLTQSVFLDMFGDPVTNRQGHELVALGDLCDVRDGTHDSPKYVDVDGHPLVTSKNLAGGWVDTSTAHLISSHDYEQINRRSRVDLGDMLMPMIGTVGNPVIVVEEPNYAIKNVALIKFHENSPQVEYVHQLMGSDYFDHVVMGGSGGTQKFVSLGDLRLFPVPLPPRQRQDEFALLRRSTCTAQSSMTDQTKELDSLFASLQSRAFAGEL